jgi:uncharacterized protein
MTNIQSSGIDPGQRRLNGLQTTGRNYRNLSQPSFEMVSDDDVAVPMRDGIPCWRMCTGLLRLASTRC